MKALGTILGTMLLAACAAQAQMIPDNVGQSSNGLPPGLVNVGFDPELHKQIPPDAAFTDENGRSVQLKEYFGKKPVVLAFVYFTCPMLCNQVEQTLVGTLKMISFNPGADYEVVFISFDPSDTPDAALKKKHEAMSRFARPGTEPGWHFLTGSKEAIDVVTKAADFRFNYDPNSAADARWPNFALFFWRRLSVQQCPPRPGGCLLRENRHAGGSYFVVLLSIRPDQSPLQRHGANGYPHGRSCDAVLHGPRVYDFPPRRASSGRFREIAPGFADRRSTLESCRYRFHFFRNRRPISRGVWTRSSRLFF
jgi:cytochrome oxidase Cu insertion factor (SCO1/SenC/PrrC family)